VWKGEGAIKLPVSSRNLASKLVPVAAESLHFKVKGTDDIVFLPYFEIQEKDFTCSLLLTGR